MNKLLAEFIGTAALVLIGCGAAVISGSIIVTALAFGLVIVAMAYAIGGISGCHVNPAVTFGMLVAGRIGPKDTVLYIVAQIAGGLAGAGLLYLILTGASSATLPITSLGQNGWGPGYLDEYNSMSALIVEISATFLFVLTILGVTSKEDGNGMVAGLAIGLTLAAIHLTFINVTGVSVNPARSIGPAVFVGGQAVTQLWLFIVAPLAGSALAAVVYRIMRP